MSLNSITTQEIISLRASGLRPGVKAKAKKYLAKARRQVQINKDLDFTSLDFTELDFTEVEVIDLGDLPAITYAAHVCTHKKQPVAAVDWHGKKDVNPILRCIYSMNLRQQRKFLDALHASQEARRELRALLPSLSHVGVEGELRNAITAYPH